MLRMRSYLIRPQLSWSVRPRRLSSEGRVIIRFALIAAGIYIVVAIVSLVTGNATLAVLPIIPVAFVVTRITRPPTYRLQRALKHLKSDLRSVSPQVIDTLVETPTDDALGVTLVCATDAEVPALNDQFPALKQRISSAAIQQGVPIDLAHSLRLRSVSRQAVEREGGWFGFHHNVSWPRSNER